MTSQKQTTGLQLLEVLQQQDIPQLDPWLQEQSLSKQEPGNCINNLKEQLDQICQQILSQVSDLTNRCGLDDAENAEQQEVAYKLTVLTKLCQFFADGMDKDSDIPEDLQQAVVILHNNCLLMALGFPELVKCTCGLCQKWFLQEFPCFEHVGIQTLMVTIFFALQDFEDEQYVLNASALRKVLKTLDYSDDTSQDFQRMLCNTFKCPSFLKIPEGREFLSCILDLTPSLIRQINAILRSQLPYWTEEVTRIYGSIVLEGWRDAQDAECKHTVEEEIFKSYMELVILVKQKKMAATLRYFLAPLHEENRHGIQLDIAALMFKYYDPIIYRYLNAPNPDVKINALNLMPEIFPLLDYNLDEPGREELIKKQVCYLKDLMRYEVISVRQCAIKVTFDIMSDWWQLLPKFELAAILKCATEELVFDGASVGVRAATINGLAILMRCKPAAREAVYKAASKFKVVLYDRSNIVQAAMIDFLRTLQDLRNFDFQEIAPIEQLLELLAANIPQVSSKIQQLLFREFFGGGGDEEDGLSQQLAQFLRAHPDAGLAFCKHLATGIARAGVSATQWESVLTVLGSLMGHLGHADVMQIEDVNSWQLLLQGVQQLFKGLSSTSNNNILQKLDEMFGMTSLLNLLRLDNSPKTRSIVFSIATDMSDLLVAVKVRHYILWWLSKKISSPINCEEEETELESGIKCVAQPATIQHLIKLIQIPLSKEYPTLTQQNDDDDGDRDLQDEWFEMLDVVQTCNVCGQGDRSEKILLCDGCGKGYHLDCLEPAMTEIPEGDWYGSCCRVQEANVTMSVQVATRVILILLSRGDSRRLLLEFERENDGFFQKAFQRILESDASAADPCLYLYVASYLSLTMMGQFLGKNPNELLQENSANLPNLLPVADEDQKNCCSENVLEAIRIVSAAWDRVVQMDDVEKQLRFVEMTCAVLGDGFRLHNKCFEYEVLKDVLQKFRNSIQLENGNDSGIDIQKENFELTADSFYEVGREASKRINS